MNELLQIALSQYGVSEIIGKEHNPKIIQYAKETGFNEVIDDETSWCSIFMNWCAMKAKLKRSNSKVARSWLKIGEAVTEPKVGDVVIFWRGNPSSWMGHVGIYIGHSEDGKYIYCLGGNQGNQVSIKDYPTKQLLGYRRLNMESNK